MSQLFPADAASRSLRYIGAPRERRREPRQPKAFAFWICRPDGRRHSAWMLDMAPSGAAFLVAADEAPPVGERIEFVEMQTTDRLVRDDAAPLPRGGRVLRHDPGDGLTRRVAVRLEADENVSPSKPESRCTTMQRPVTWRVRPVLPVAASKSAGLCVVSSSP